MKIQQLCQQYTRNVTKTLTETIKELENYILKAQELIQTTANQDQIEVLYSKRTALSDLYRKKAQGALIRSRFQGVEDMDVPSKYFFGLEKKNGQKRNMKNLCSDTGIMLSDPNEIRKRATDFYKRLYSCEYKENQALKPDFFEGLPKISKNANVKLCKGLTTIELYGALQSMENGKVPGIDGIPFEFYKAFWGTIGEDLQAVLSDSLAGGLLPLSSRRAVLTLLPKKGDLGDIKNWRPVSLLCSDYKILSKVLAIRLGKVLEEVIHSDQCYCVPGRSISDSIFLVRDLIEYSTLCNSDFGLISIDQEKAFDRVEHAYLWETLNAFGFNSNFIKLIKVL